MLRITINNVFLVCLFCSLLINGNTSLVKDSLAELNSPLLRTSTTHCATAPDNDDTVEVLADQKIEWQRDTRRLIAKGNVRLSRSGTVVHADVLTAYYRDRATGFSQEIYQLQAEGNVRIISQTETISGEIADYNIDKRSLVLRGRPICLKTSTNEVILANNDITYHQNQQIAIARGDVHVTTKEGYLLHADEISVTLSGSADKQKQTNLVQATAKGNVQIETARETIRGEYGTYDARTGTATLTGSVKITSNTNQLDGAHAILNFKTGHSYLYAKVPGSEHQFGTDQKSRVKILIFSEKRKNRS